MNFTLPLNNYETARFGWGNIMLQRRPEKSYMKADYWYRFDSLAAEENDH